MGCSQSEEKGASSGGSAVKEVLPADYIILPEPTGEKVYLVYGKDVVCTTHITSAITCQDLIHFMNWKLAEYKDSLPDKGGRGIEVSGLASAEGMQEGIMLTPTDVVIQSDQWQEGERHLVGIGSEWIITTYLDDDQLMEKFEAPRCCCLGLWTESPMLSEIAAFLGCRLLEELRWFEHSGLPSHLLEHRH